MKSQYCPKCEITYTVLVGEDKGCPLCEYNYSTDEKETGDGTEKRY